MRVPGQTRARVSTVINFRSRLARSQWKEATKEASGFAPLRVSPVTNLVRPLNIASSPHVTVFAPF